MTSFIPSTGNTATAYVPSTTDWTKCALCQKVTSENLQCPAKSLRNDNGVGYNTLAENIKRFNEINQLPIDIDICRLDEGTGISDTFQQQQAMWHKTCKDKFNNTKLKRAEKREHSTNSKLPKKYTRLSGAHSGISPELCFFCELETSDPLRNASTFQLDSRVRSCALALQDERILAKLSAGDLVAIEAKYHPKCLVAFYRKANEQQQVTQKSDHDRMCHGIAFAELVSYIDELHNEEDSLMVLKLAELTRMYTARLQQLGVEQSSIRSTTLKNRILGQFPDMSEHKDGRDVLLAFNKDIGIALKKSYENNYDDDAMCLAKAASIVRRDMLRTKAVFSGSFSHDCQEKAIPDSLLALSRMILDGPDIKSQSVTVSQEGLSVSQLLLFNSNIRRRCKSTGSKHNKDRETPLAIYVGLMVHAKTRSRDIVDMLHHLGLSVSYDRVMDISTALGNRLCNLYNAGDKVCPVNLRGGLFTTAAVDNIDHNPSSTTASGSFHGTAISLFQHPTPDFSGTYRSVHEELEVTQCRNVAALPESYTLVPQVEMRVTSISAPTLPGAVKGNGEELEQALNAERR